MFLQQQVSHTYCSCAGNLQAGQILKIDIETKNVKSEMKATDLKTGNNPGAGEHSIQYEESESDDEHDETTPLLQGNSPKTEGKSKCCPWF